MVGIVAYGAYIPVYRLNLAETGKRRGEESGGEPSMKTALPWELRPRWTV